jgi:outer membrane protein assembly factor BamB
MTYMPQLAYDQGRVYALNQVGQLTGYAPATGAQLWSDKLGVTFGETVWPVALDGIVYIGAAWAVNGANGQMIWSHEASGNTVAADGDRLYNAINGPQVYAYSRSNGALAWHYDSGSDGGGVNIPTLYGGHLYVRDGGPCTCSAHIYDLATGHILGAIEYTGSAFGGGLIVEGSDHSVRAIDPMTGATRWTYPGDIYLQSAQPVIVGNVVYVQDLSTLLALDLHSGALLWSTHTPNYDTIGTLTAGEGTLIVTTTNGNLLAYTGHSAFPPAPTAPNRPSAAPGPSTTAPRPKHPSRPNCQTKRRHARRGAHPRRSHRASHKHRRRAGCRGAAKHRRRHPSPHRS